MTSDELRNEVASRRIVEKSGNWSGLCNLNTSLMLVSSSNLCFREMAQGPPRCICAVLHSFHLRFAVSLLEEVTISKPRPMISLHRQVKVKRNKTKGILLDGDSWKGGGVETHKWLGSRGRCCRRGREPLPPVMEVVSVCMERTAQIWKLQRLRTKRLTVCGAEPEPLEILEKEYLWLGSTVND
jgi:hypothetical protein